MRIMSRLANSQFIIAGNKEYASALGFVDWIIRRAGLDAGRYRHRPLLRHSFLLGADCRPDAIERRTFKPIPSP